MTEGSNQSGSSDKAATTVAPSETKPPATAPAPAAPAAPTAAAPEASPKRKRLRLIALGVIVTAVAGIGIWYWLNADLEKTDNAQIDGDVVPIRAQTGGIVERIHFQDNQIVEVGTLLVEIRKEPHEIAVAEAKAKLAEAKASLAAAEAEVQRIELTNPGELSVANAALMQTRAAVSVADGAIKEARARYEEAKRERTRSEELFARKAITQVKLEQARAALQIAEAALRGAESQRMQAVARQREMEANKEKTGALQPKLAEAKAKVDAARARVSAAETAHAAALLDLSYTRVTAPVRGIASKRVVTTGQLVAAGQPIVTLVQVDRLWVTANFKETQIGRMRPGQHVDIYIDAYDGARISGQVESLSAATGARFSLLPPDNATGNFTKVVQRVPVRIRITDVPAAIELRPGLSVEVTVNVENGASTAASPTVRAPDAR